MSMCMVGLSLKHDGHVVPSLIMGGRMLAGCMNSSAKGKGITSLYSTNFDRSLDTMMEDRVSVGGTVLSEQNIFRFFTSCRHR